MEMDINVKTAQGATDADVGATANDAPSPGVEKLSALDLNNIRLDVKHTVLTPDYLEKLSNATK